MTAFDGLVINGFENGALSIIFWAESHFFLSMNQP